MDPPDKSDRAALILLPALLLPLICCGLPLVLLAPGPAALARYWPASAVVLAVLVVVIGLWYVNRRRSARMSPPPQR